MTIYSVFFSILAHSAPVTGSEEASDSAGIQKSQNFAIDDVPKNLERRVTLLKYFAKYMDDNLIRGELWHFWGGG